MLGFTIDEMSIGQSATFTKTITEADVTLFAGVSGDLNPVHINETFAKDTMFKGRIAHGMLCGSLVSAVLGMYLPGPGCILLKQEMKFLAPVYFNDTLTASCVLKEKNEEKNTVVFNCKVTNQAGVDVIVGEAKLMPRKAQ